MRIRRAIACHSIDSIKRVPGPKVCTNHLYMSVWNVEALAKEEARRREHTHGAPVSKIDQLILNCQVQRPKG